VFNDYGVMILLTMLWLRHCIPEWLQASEQRKGSLPAKGSFSVKSYIFIQRHMAAVRDDSMGSHTAMTDPELSCSL